MSVSKKIIFSFLLMLSMIFHVPNASAVLGVEDTSWDWVNQIYQSLTKEGVWTIYGEQVYQYAADLATRIAVTAAKIAALQAVKKATASLIGGDGGSSSLIISDYTKYLYTDPQKVATQKMNTFFNSTTGGRTSSSNYEGAGSNYANYLVKQAKNSYQGINMNQTIQNKVSDPSKMFDQGNMKSFNEFLKCPNNIYCYSLVAETKYNSETEKAQKIATSEQQNGYLPRKKNGLITAPAALAENAMLQLDQMGTNMILQADDLSVDSIEQIATGSVLAITGRLSNYGISVATSEITNTLNENGISLEYDSKNGVSVTGTSQNGAATINTGVGSSTNSGISGSGTYNYGLGQTTVTGGTGN